MEVSEVAKRYAEALSEVAGDDVASAEESLGLVSAVIASSNEVRAFFESPKIASETKKQLFEKAFSGKVSELIMNFLRLLADKRREALVPEIFLAFELHNDKRLGRVRAQVSISREALKGDEGLFDQIKQTILDNRAAFGETKEIKKENLFINTRIRPEILGGVIIRIGDFLFDGSVRNAVNEWQKGIASHKITLEQGWSE